MAARRTRRSTDEVRRLILEAAVQVFESKGYSQTTMDDIAAEAGVARSAMFRHFASKSDLFHAAQLQPFLDLMTTFKQSLDAEIEELWEEERLMRTAIETVYDGFRAHRNGMLAIASMRELDPAAYREALAVIDGAFEDVVERAVAETKRRGWAPQRDLGLSIRIVIGMVASMSVLEPIFVPQGRGRPSRNQIIDQLTEVALHGVRAESAVSDEASPSPQPLV
jgi:AcrR family transcriptional regulator